MLDVVGFDASVVERWLHRVAGVTPPLEWVRLPGGHSNLTYRLTDSDGRQLVVRRPPLGQLLPKAHDMWREYRIIDALWHTSVPVPEPIAFCDDRAVADTHFYVMGSVAGSALYSGTMVADLLDVDARRHASESFCDALAALHSIEPADVGLADLGRPDGYVARQLSTWYRSWNAQVSAASYDDARMHRLHEHFVATLPASGPARVVHGDFGPHNLLFSGRGDVTAVLDWELATLGDPLADFAYSLNAWTEPGDSAAATDDPPTTLPGFSSREQMTARYAAATDADLAALPYYRALNSWKLACILHGVYARYKSGQKDSSDVDLDAIFRRMTAAIEAASALDP